MKTGEMPFSEQVIVSRVISIDGNDLELFDHLRKIRITLAKEEKLPPFTICNDEALLAISKIKPTKVEDLVRIKGIGPRFIEKRSRLFLDEVKSFLNTHEIIEDESSESWDINSLNDELSKKSGVFFVDDPVEINSTPDQEKLFSNQGKPWSKKLDLELSESFKRGKTISELSKQFKRSSGGIRSRLVKMGLIENTGYPTETEK
jgi:ATP-dependent DNA helicase RecQ